MSAPVPKSDPTLGELLMILEGAVVADALRPCAFTNEQRDAARDALKREYVNMARRVAEHAERRYFVLRGKLQAATAAEPFGESPPDLLDDRPFIEIVPMTGDEAADAIAARRALEQDVGTPFANNAAKPDYAAQVDRLSEAARRHGDWRHQSPDGQNNAAATFVECRGDLIATLHALHEQAAEVGPLREALTRVREMLTMRMSERCGLCRDGTPYTRLAHRIVGEAHNVDRCAAADLHSIRDVIDAVLDGKAVKS